MLVGKGMDYKSGSRGGQNTKGEDGARELLSASQTAVVHKEEAGRVDVTRTQMSSQGKHMAGV